ncbi:hypothetical protein [Snodgrassella sp. CFCC 13594]|uniref:hypothetical protein n=1 Tax=Snodgrassella sp. CFCC 13594 TaxID=1775559 RepID=UPI00082C9042|nr:hypothetical protein [Snodgrassella sp. CFCC 13594]
MIYRTAERFKAMDDVGNVYHISKMVEQVKPAPTYDDPNPPQRDGLAKLVLNNGVAVNYVDENTFETLSGAILKRI